MDLKQIQSSLEKMSAAKIDVQARLDKLIDRRQWLTTTPLPRADFIKYFLEVQGGRENQLPHRLSLLTKNMVNEPMGTIKIKTINDSPLCWPRGTDTIPNDVWHIILGDAINKVLADALEQIPWPEGDEVGPPRAERAEELATIEAEIAELRAWLDQAAALMPRETSNVFTGS